ncbi:hypothetical protein Tco_0278430 [Tanacetum coccineum]
MTRVNMFVDKDTELVKESLKKVKAEMAQESCLKRAGDELEQEKEKKQKIDDDQEEVEMKKLIKVVPDEEEVAIDAIPLATKPPSIVDWKIILRDFDREDLETLWKLVKAEHGSTRPKEGYERIPVETPEQPFIEPGNLKFIQSFLKIVGYQGLVDKGMLIPADLITDEIQDTQEYKDYVEEFGGVTIKQKKPISITIPSPSDDRERDEIQEATQLSLALHKTVKLAEEQENVAAVEEQLLKEDVEKIVEGEDEDSYASEFADSVFLNKEDTSARLEPGSHKENPEIVDDDDDDVNEKKDDKKDDDNDDDNDNHDDHALELIATISPTPTTTSQDRSKSKPTSSKTKEKRKEMSDTLNNLVLELIVAKTNELTKEAVPRMVNDAVKKDREISTTNVPELISQKFAVHAPKIIEKLFKTHMKNKPLLVLAEQMLFANEILITIRKMMLLLRGRKERKDKGHQKARNLQVDTVIDKDEVIPEDKTLELIEEFQNVDKDVLAIFDHERMKTTLRDMMTNQFKDAKEYAYHLEKLKNYMENQIVWEIKQEDIRQSKPYSHVFYGPQRNPNEPPRYLYNKDLFFLKNGNSEERKYVILLHKIHVVPFPKEDLEEKMNRWVRKEFKCNTPKIRVAAEY